MPKKAKATRKTAKKVVKKKVMARKVVEKTGTLPPPSVSDATGGDDDNWEDGEIEEAVE